MQPCSHALQVDGRRYSPYTAVAASTVDLTLAIAAVRAIRRPLLAPGFHAKVLLEAEPRQLVRMLPALMSERAVDGMAEHPNAMRMQLFGPYTLDGELFHEPALAPDRLPLTVEVAEQRLHAIPGELGATQW